MTEGQRRLTWESLLNARDLGGLPVAGGRIRPGALVRSDSLVRLTEAGRAAMLAHGVATVVDVRSPRELANHPSPLRDHAAYRPLPLLDDAGIAEVGRFDTLIETYLWQIETQAVRIATIMRGIAEAPAGGVLVHCAAGKDRTGIVVALVLAVAGVDADAIAGDYALSRWWAEGMMERELAAQPNGAARARLRRMYESRPEIMLAMLSAIGRRHGGVGRYLTAVGAGEDLQERLRARLR